MTTKAVEKVKANAAVQKTSDIKTLIERSVKELGKALPSHMNPERLVRIALTTLRLNPALYDCTPESFLGALFQSAQLGLEPNVEGQAYILPFNNNRKKPDGSWHTVKEAQFQIGYKGYAELFYRHEKSLSLDMQLVKANDKFDYQYGTDSYLHHKPAENDRGDVIGYYAVAKLANGATLFRYMSKADAMEHGKKFSKCYDRKTGEFYPSTPWSTNPDAMCMKTVLMQLAKLLPKSIEIQRALAMDETIKTKVDKDMFNVPTETDWTEKPQDAEVVKIEDVAKAGDDEQITPELEKVITDLAKKAGEEKAYEILTTFKVNSPSELSIGDAKKVIEKLSQVAFKK